MFCARCNFIDQFQIVNITGRCKSSTPTTTPTTTTPTTTTPTTDYPTINEFTSSTVQTTIPTYDVITTTPTKTPTLKLIDRLHQCTYAIDYTIRSKELYECKKDLFLSRNDCLPTNSYYKLCHAYQARTNNFANYHCCLCAMGKEKSSERPTPGSCTINRVYPTTAFPTTDNPTTDYHTNTYATTATTTYTTTPTTSTTTPTTNYPTTDHPTISWSFTLSFSQQTTVDIVGPVELHESYCNNCEVYNIFTGKCNKFVCSNGYMNLCNTCKIIVTNGTDNSVGTSLLYDNCLNKEKVAIMLVSNATTDFTEVNRALNKVLNSTKQIEFRKFYSNNTLTFYQADIISAQDEFSNVVKEFSNSKSQIWNYIQEGFIANKNLIVTELYGVDGSRTFSRYRLCASRIIYDIGIDNHTENCTTIRFNSTISNDNIYRWITFNRYTIKRKISVCHRFHLQSPCKLTPIYSNYSILSNQTLVINDKSYSVDQYLPLPKGIAVCIKTHNTTHYKWQATVADVNKYIMYTFTSISIVCYTVIILVHLYFKELKTVPGLIAIALCMTLLITDVLITSSNEINENFYACKVIGILLHWGLLSAQLWVVILAFDLLSKFGSVAMTTRTSKIMSKYCAFVVLISTIIVGVSVSLNELQIYHFGYGLNNVCFIYNLYPRIYFYIVPVGICILITTFSFVHVIASIKRQEDRTRKILHNSGRKDIDIFIIGLKLVLTLGLIEIIGFIQISKDSLTEAEEIFNSIFATLYTLFRSCRGIVLFTLYILTKDKCKLFKSKFNHSNKMINLVQLNKHTEDTVERNSPS